MELIIFYLLAVIAIGSALLVVSLRNIARSLFLFFVTLFSVAGLFILALADFIAITQVMVYVGGVLVLMLFAFMLSNKQILKDLHTGINHFFALPTWQASVVSLSFLGIIVYVAVLVSQSTPSWISASIDTGTHIRPSDNTVHQLGIQIMTRYLLPFEIVSVMLMMALIGAAHLTRKGNKT